MRTTSPVRPALRPGAPSRDRSAIAVEILVCGSADRSDDGAPIAACQFLRGQLPAGVSLRIVGQLDIDDLLAIRKGAGVVIVDTATGIDAGTIVDLPLSGLVGQGTVIQPRSSHALAIPAVVGLADMIRGRPLHGRIVAIGGSHFGLGRPVSRPVAAALPSLARAILDAVRHVRRAGDPSPGGS